MSNTKTPTAASLRDERAALQSRRDELQATHDDGARALAAAQADLVDGTDGAEAAVTEAQARVSGTDGALAMLDERAAALDARIAEAEHAEALEAHRSTLRQGARDAAAARARFVDTVDGARRALVEAAAQAAEVETAWAEASLAFASAHSALKAAGEDPADVIAAAGLDDRAALDDRFHHVLSGNRAGTLPHRHTPRPELGPATDTAWNAVAQVRDVLARTSPQPA